MYRQLLILALAVVALLGSERVAHAQIKSTESDSLVRYGDVQITRFRVGAKVNAKRGAVRDVLAIVAVPLSCPEQEVVLVEEDITEAVKSHEYRTLPGGGAKQFMINIPYLANKTKAHALLTFEVRTRKILPPKDTSQLVIPKKPPRDVKRYMGKSPFIETNHSKIKKLARKILADLEQPTSKDEEQNEAGTSQESAVTDWQRVEAIYDHLIDTIEYKEQDDKSALQTLRDGHGDCQNVSALFVALCRTLKIPARIVWVDQHNYPEFCLADAEGKLHWFPCESSGTRAFGEMPLARVIMQKGDNFKVPEKRKTLRYASDYMTGVPAQAGGGPPGHRFVREAL